MIRNLLYLIVFLGLGYSLEAQAKRYIFLEHFTNSRCGICAGSNPGFYSLLENYKGQYHHISIHPSIPYSSCLLYQSNKEDNTARTTFYNILGTPTVVINGLNKKSAGSITAATLNAELNKTSPIQIVVKETGSGTRTADIEIKTVGVKPNGNYRLFVAFVERVLNYASPNGETVHYDVMRDFMSAVEGEDIQLADNGSSVKKSYTINLQPSWMENQMYAIAWVQDMNSKEVLNSGTKFDVVTSTDDQSATIFSIFPNPVKDVLEIQWPKALKERAHLTISGFLGKELYNTDLPAQSSVFRLGVSTYPAGIYFVKLEAGNDRIIRKWIKQ